MVHINTFHAGPVCRSCIMKFMGPEAGGKAVTPAPDTCALSLWLLSYPRAPGEMEQEDPTAKDLEPTSRNPWRSPVAHIKPGLLSIPFNILDIILNLPNSTSFFPCLP